MIRQVPLTFQQNNDALVPAEWSDAAWPDEADMPWIDADGSGAEELKLPQWTLSLHPVSSDAIYNFLTPHKGGFLEPHWIDRTWVFILWWWRYLTLAFYVALSRQRQSIARAEQPSTSATSAHPEQHRGRSVRHQGQQQKMERPEPRKMVFGDTRKGGGDWKARGALG